jgi:triosephosphate isomerase
MTPIVGVSLKAYFGYRQTLDYCNAVARRLAGHPALVSGEVRLFVLPSFPAIVPVAEIFKGTPIAVGAQNLWSADSGAFTGEVTGPMLHEAGARFVEVGHAERRTIFAESEQLVTEKTAAALRTGLTPVLCIGEADEVSASEAAAECIRQARSALDGATDPVVIAYEPFWAIGAPQPAGDEHIKAVCTALKRELPGSSIIYGGSAGPGLYTRLDGAADGLFLGRFAHDPRALAEVVEEAVPR